jgi:hypothetical protein
MSNQLVITSGAKVRSLNGVITGTTGVLDSLPINAANGIPQLDSSGKILVSQLPNSVMEFKGVWDAATNTPTLADGTGNAGDVYLCNVAGTVNFGSGPIAFIVGDYVVYTGTVWAKSGGASGTVTSVAVTESGDALNITGSPITTSGTINIGFAGTSAQYVAGDGSLITFPSIISEAQNLITEVYNETGATLTKGTIVYINGGHGNLPTVTKAIATSDATSAQTYGVVRTDITNNNNGYVTVIGSLSDLDTQAYSAGTQLYLSGTTAGAWTSTKPSAPIHLVYVGIVVRAHPTQGVVEVRIQNGYELGELHDVAISSPTNNQGIFYNSSTSLWENKSIATALGYTPISLTSLSATSPLSYNNITGVFSISQASGLTDGYLSQTDWNTFNGKQNALSNPITGTGVSSYIPIFNGTTTVIGSNQLRFDTSNNLLIGNPSTGLANLHVYNSSAAASLLLQTDSSTDYGEIAVRNNASTATSYFRQYSTAATGSDFGISRANLALFFSNYASNFAIGTRNGGDLILGTADTERARITASGNVLIGTTTDSGYKLNVNGNGVFSSNLGIINSSTTYGCVFYLSNTSNTKQWNFTTVGSGVSGRSGNLEINNNIADILAITQSGNVGIGTSSPGATLDVNGNLFLSAGAPISLLGTGSGTYNKTVIYNNTTDGFQIDLARTTDSGGGTPIPFKVTVRGGSEWMRITSGGLFYYGVSSSTNTALFTAKAPASSVNWSFGPNNANTTNIFRVENSDTTGVYLTSGNTSWTANSDERLKDITGNIENALDKLCTLRTVKYTWKKDKTNKVNLGLIAQDVLKVLPEVVDIQEDEINTLGVKYTELVPVLVKAIQELSNELNELKAKIK